ncbi:LysM domain-containing protein [uncultured Vibrio sp.]|uniref:LysM peptidoglycan-binding domain-containing protein n=1 Tax=uncultured Vibrio sp. TaxID=114054 RepID=UPI002626504D|nr:LysM domain-containing protein [uncultured Vibrio sp.]
MFYKSLSSLICLFVVAGCSTNYEVLEKRSYAQDQKITDLTLELKFSKQLREIEDKQKLNDLEHEDFRRSIDELRNVTDDLREQLKEHNELVAVNDEANINGLTTDREGLYIIEYGDTLSEIAIRERIDVESLLILNPEIYDRHLIFSGNSIKLK